MKHIFIINSISGRGQGPKLLSLIKEISEAQGLDYLTEMTTHPGHARELAQQYSALEDTCLYSVGGDGTLLEVINGIDTDTPLSVIPAGSGNDFYRLIGPDPSDYRKILSDSLSAEIRRIDIGENDRMRFLNTTSFGMDADVNAYASNLIRRTMITKGPAYLLGILNNMFILRPKHVKMKVDEQELEGDYLIVSCMNGRYYGNGIQAAPESDLQDGYFDLCLLENMPRRRAYPFLAKYLQGKHLGTKGFSVIRCKKIDFLLSEETSCQSDGENFTASALSIKIKERFLALKAPSYLNIIH